MTLESNTDEVRLQESINHVQGRYRNRLSD